jgi:hypothetical protein
MARIELSNIGGGGTTLSLTTTGTSGASTLAGSVLNIPIYQGQLTLTTTGTSGAATLVGDTLNIPQYSGGGTPAGSAGQIQFNSTPAGSFAASANLAWDNSAVQLNIGAPSSPTGTLNVKGSGTLTTVNTRLTDSGNTELVKVLDNGSTNIGANFNWDNVNSRLGLGTSTPNQTLEVSGAMRLTGTAGTAAFMLGRNSAGDVSTVTLGTTGTSGAATLSANVLNIPQYQGALTLTTSGTSGAATLVGNTLNIPQYSGGGGTPAGSTGEIQYNNAGAFGASSNLAWDNSNVRLNVGAPSSPTGRLNVKGSGTLTTVNTRLTNSGDTELFKVLDNGNTNIGTGFNWDNANNRLGINSAAGTSGRVIITSNGQRNLVINSTGNEATGSVLFTGGDNAFFSAEESFYVCIDADNNQTNRVFGIKSNTYGSVGGRNLFSVDESGNTTVGEVSTAGEYRMSIGATTHTVPSLGALRVTGLGSAGGKNTLLIQNSGSNELMKIEDNGKITYRATNTAAGTTGAQTIDRPSGTVNFLNGTSALVVTNSLCTTSSIVFATVRTNDATAYIKNVVPAAGSFTINLGANATAETSVGFFIIN